MAAPSQTSALPITPSSRVPTTFLVSRRYRHRSTTSFAVVWTIYTRGGTTMHELAIAQSITEIVCRHAAGRRVSKVDLTVGRLRQVVPSSLAFSFELVSQGTVAEGAELEMHPVPAVVLCRDCGAGTEVHAFPF